MKLKSLGELSIIKTIYKGAEAVIYLAYFNGEMVIVKKRIPKPYRHRELDRIIRLRRMLHEARMLHYVKRLGIHTPTLIDIDLKEYAIIMEYIPGVTLKEYLLNSRKLDSKQISLLREFGKIMGILHENNIMHGDPTIANVIVLGNKLILVDLGLSKNTSDVEDHGTDMHLLLRILESTFGHMGKLMFKHVLEGYASIRGLDTAMNILRKVYDIRSRGRYVKFRGKSVWQL